MSDVPSQFHTRPSVLVRLREPGDEEAWRLFLATYAPLIHRTCRRYGLQDADAADVAQEVLLGVVRHLRSFTYQPERGRFRDWLGTVVKHRVFRFLDRRARGEQAVGGDETDDVFTQAAGEADPEWAAEFNAHLLTVALERVRPQVEETTWRAFEGVWLKQRSAPEVAAELGVGVEAVYVAKSRVLKRLREQVLELAEDVPQLLPR